MADLGKLVTAVQGALQDSAGRLASSEIAACIAEAITGRFSQARPFTRIADIAGDGSAFEWALSPANLPGYVEDFSTIENIEYPAGRRPPVNLAKDEYGIYRAATSVAVASATGLISITGTPAEGDIITVYVSTDGGSTSTTAAYTALTDDGLFEVTEGIVEAINAAIAVLQASGGNGSVTLQASSSGAAANDIEFKASRTGSGLTVSPTAFTALNGGVDAVYPFLRMASLTPDTGKTLRVTYTGSHPEDASTVSVRDFYAVMNQAANLCCLRLAQIYTQSGDDAIDADVVDYRGKADQYRSAAKQFEKEFEKSIGTDADTKPSAAGGTAVWSDPPASNFGRMTH